MNITMLGFNELKISEVEDKHLNAIKSFCSIFSSTTQLKELSNNVFVIESNSTEDLYIFLYNLTLQLPSHTITLS